MATIGIRIVYAGNQSVPGHMYVVFTDDDGSVETFGHYPDSKIDGMGGPGGVVRDDIVREKRGGLPGVDGVPNVSRDFTVGPADFQRARDYAREAATHKGDPTKKWGQYDPLYRSCVDFTWNVARQAGLRKDKVFEGYLFPRWNKDALDETYYDFFRRPEFNREFRRGVDWRQPTDPLILDLDGDGVELTGGDADIVFDHNNDEIKTGSQWVRPDDGLLVRDLNANGVVDSGRELFGDQTHLPNGQLALDGFAALAALDNNHDAVIDAGDAGFSELSVWRDLNQDGISQGEELQSLSEAGITSINSPLNLGQPRTFTKTTLDASGNPTGTTQAIKNVNFATNVFYSEFIDNPVVTEAAASLPQMQGSGLVRDMREAMSLGTVHSTALQQILDGFKAATTTEARQALLTSVITAWANTSSMGDAMARNPIPANASSWYSSSPGHAIAAFAASQPALYQQLTALERFNGEAVIERYTRSTHASYYEPAQARWVGYTYYTVRIEAQRLAFFQNAYDVLKANIYEGLYRQTAGADLLDRVELIISDKGVRLDFTDVNEAFAQKLSTNPAQATVELAEFLRFTRGSLSDTGWDGAAQLADWLETVVLTSEQSASMQYLQLNFATDAGGGLNGTTGVDILVGKVGSDTLTGNAGADILIGGASNDVLIGGQGNDELVGGEGADYMDGQWGNDTYFWGRGQGNDSIVDTFVEATGDANTIVLRGLNPEDLCVSIIAADYYSAVRIVIKDTGETLLLRNSQSGYYDRAAAAVKVIFADGTQWDMPELLRQSLPLPTEGSDILVGTILNDLPDRLNGGAGDDLIIGRQGADVVEGGAGNDTIWSNGNLATRDRAGNTIPPTWVFRETYQNSDTYVFGLGDGQDTIVDVDYSSPGPDHDVLRFKAELAPQDLVLAQRGSDLVVSIKESTDQVTVKDFFYAIFNRSAGASSQSTVEQFEFADGTSWNIARIVSEAFKGTSEADNFIGSWDGDHLSGGEGSDILNGVDGDDTLEGSAGNDTLLGGEGDDILDGGAGNDLLTGGDGADTIRFGLGDGQDVLTTDNDWAAWYGRYYNNQAHIAAANNTVELKAGIAPENVKLTRVDRDLVISIRGTTDTLTVKYFIESGFGATPLPTQFNLLAIRFADGSSWGPEEMLAQILLGDPTDETLTGLNGSEVLHGAGGNDLLIGGGGGDTYLFGRGDGKDRVQGDGYYNADILRFREGVSAQDVQVRRVGENAVFTILDTGESISFQYGFSAYVANEGIQLAEVQFADSTVWTREQIAQLAIQGTAGNDLLTDVMWSEATTLTGGAGDDTLQGIRGTTVYTFARGDGRDTVLEDYSSSYNDTIVFSNDIVASDLMGSLSGDDLIIGIHGTADQLTIKGDRGARVEIFEVGGVALDHAQILSLIGSETRESLLGSSGDDLLVGTNKHSDMSGFEGNDVLIGNEGNDSLEGGDGDDLLQGNAGSDSLRGDAGGDLLEGGSGADLVEGGDGDDTLLGGEDLDFLFGNAGNDILNGGAGRDILEGGTGNNTYRFDRGGLLDVITLDPSATDLIELGDGIALADITVQVATEYDYQAGVDVVTRVVIGFGGNDALAIEPQSGSAPTADFAQFLSLRLSDGTTLAFDDIMALKDDGVAGSQYRYLSDGTVLGSQADDQIDAYGDNLFVAGRDNNDRILVVGNANLADGGAGDDELYINQGDAVLAGGTGNDTLSSLNGSRNTFVFNAGDGQDRVSDDYARGTISFGRGIAASDIRLWIDTSNGDLVLSIGNNGDEVRTAWFDEEFETPLSSRSLALAQLIDAEGRVSQYDLEALMASAQYSPAAIGALAPPSNAPVLHDAAEFLSVAAGPVMGGIAAIAYAQTGDLRGTYTIAGNDDLSGNNRLLGTPEADTLDGGSGNDSIEAAGGDDLVWGGDGDDYLDGQAGDDQIYGGEGNDVMRGGAGEDRLVGGRGDNQAFGGAGYDTYAYAKGDGTLYIEDIERLEYRAFGGFGGYGSSYENELVFGPDITLADLRFSRVGEQLVITVAGGAGDVITLAGFDSERLSGNRSVERFVFQAGESLELSDIWNSPEVTVVTSGDESVEGTSFNDELRGGFQADVLEGSYGNDRLIGGAGNDAYLIDDDDGNDVIVDSAMDANIVVFTGSIAADELSLTVDGGVSALRFGDSSIVLEGWSGATADLAPVSQFVFSDGTILSMNDLFDRSRGIVGTEHDDRLNGAGGNDEIHGLQGDDLIMGGDGADTYVVEANSGHDTITDLSVLGEENTVVFADLNDPATVRLTLSADGALEVQLEEGNSLTLTDFNRQTPLGARSIDFFQFGFDGPVLNYSELLERGFLMEGTADGDVLLGTALHDVFLAGAGDDSMERSTGGDEFNGGSGNDSYAYNLGDGLVTINDVTDASGANVLRFGADITPESIERKLRLTVDPIDPSMNRFLLVFDENNQISISGFDPQNPAAGAHGIEYFEFADGTVLSWNELLDKVFVLEGDADANALQGTARSDRLYGYEGADNLSGGARDDVITGGSGNDVLEGGEGLDNYVFNLGDGQDVLYDEDSNNTISFGEGILADSISVVRETSGFTVSYGTLGDSIFIEGAGALSTPVANFELADGTILRFGDFLNQAPVLGNTLQDHAGRVGDAFSFVLEAGAFTDPDGDPLEWAAQLNGDQPLPAWLQFDPVTRTFAGTPPAGAHGAYQLQVFARDPSGVAMSQLFMLDVASRNTTPELTGDTATIAEDVPPVVTGNVLSNDLDADASDTLAVVSAGVFQGTWGSLTLSVDGSYTYTLNNADADIQSLKAGQQVVDSFTYTATDGTINAHAQLVVTVTGTNDAPTLVSAIVAQAATEDAAFVFAIPAGSFADDDAGDTLTYTSTLADGSSLPSWLSFNATTGVFSGTPVNADVGNLALILTATDASGASVSEAFNVAVANVNDAPVLTRVIDVQTTAQNQLFSFTLPANTFYDIDVDDALALSATLANGDVLPDWLSFDAGTATFSGTPTNGDVGQLSVRVIATDAGGLAVASTFNMTVGNVNDAPVVAAALVDQAAIQGQLFSFVLPANTFAEVDVGDTLVYSATLANGDPLPTWLGFNATSGTFSGTPANGDVGALNVRVAAMDSAGAIASSVFTLTIGNVNDAPVLAQPLADATGAEDAAFSYVLPAGGFADIDAADSLTYAATLVNGDPLPSWLSFNAAAGTFSGTPLNANVGSLDIRVTATDASGAFASDVFSIAITNTNDAPVVEQAIANATALEDQAFSFMIPASTFVDADVGDTLVYVAQLANGNPLPSWLSFNPATGTFSGTPANGDVGNLSVLVTATDISGASASDVFELNVGNTNDTPVAGNDLGSAVEDGGSVTLTAAALLVNDADVDAGDSKHISAVAATSAAGAGVTLVNGNVVYNPGSLLQSLAQGATTTDTFSYTMSDNAGATSTATVTMTITGTNDAPVLALQTAAQTATQGAAFALVLPAGTFTDVDAGTNLRWSASLANGGPLPSWLVFNAATGTFSGTPGSNDVGAFTLRVTATDQVGASATESFALTVQGGSTQGQTFIGTSGNDVLNGTAYDDVLDGRAGNDILMGGAGKDIMTGGAGSDKLLGEAGDDTLGFSADSTWTDSHRAVNVGSPGNAGSGENVSLSGKSRSHDIFNSGAGYDALVGTNGNDALFLDDSYSPPDGYVGPRIQQIELISMEGGNDVVDLTSRRYAYGDVTIDGGAGNDVLWASSGNDQLLGGDGNDQLDGGAGNDILGGGSGNDALDGGNGNDVLDGGTGNDDLSGGLGNDIYLHSLNGGANVISDKGGQDVIRFTAGISSNAVSVTRHHNDLVLKVAGQNGSVTVENWFDSSADRIERVEFADGTVWNENALRELADGDYGGGWDGGGCGPGRNSNNGHDGHDDDHSSYDRGESRDKKKDDQSDSLANAIDQINERLAAAPRHDFGSLAAYLSQQASGSTGPLTAAQIARQWNTVRGSLQRLGQDADGARQGVEGGSFGSGDALVQAAMHWGFAGSVGQSRAAGGMSSLNGLSEGFKKLN